MRIYSKTKFLGATFILCSITAFLLHRTNVLSGIVAIATVLLASFNLWLVYLLYVPKEYGKVKFRRATVTVVLLIYGGFAGLIKNIDTDIIKTVRLPDGFTKLNDLPSSTEIIIIISLIALGIILFCINYFLQDKSAMKEHEDTFNSNFPERDFNERLRSFCNFLKNRIDHLDTEANWSDAHFTPIDAEVEIFRAKGKIKKITSLLKAIKADNKSKVFLILGEPGSGKSVALRKLCRDLISEVEKTRKIPIYLNLKEWLVNRKWSEEKPPSGNDIYDFCISYMKGKDIFADEFIDKYFKRLHENGHIFFIIDSFDEVPAVLDVDESSWLIDKLSENLFNFLGGAHESRGVLASRYFRKPTQKFKASSILNIRPFSEYKIHEALNRYIALDKQIVQSIFTERTDLLPIASNPFSVGLIHSYIKTNNSLPTTQAELYSSYIKSRLTLCKEKIKNARLDSEAILQYSKEIATFMLHNANFGLEASIHDLKIEFANTKIEEIIDILVYARIGRIGRGDEKRFSFVHRRFNEYFVIQKYINRPDLIDKESIPQDSRFRDSLVLYCEVAPKPIAEEIAAFCWNEIKQIKDADSIQLRRSIHCLRFLVEAFNVRRDILDPFITQLGELIFEISSNYHTYKHPLITKISVEAVGIIDQKNMGKTLIECFNINNWWINYTAIQSCRHLQTINKPLCRKITDCVLRIEHEDLLQQKEELLFSLSLSEPFKPIKLALRLRLLDFYLLITALMLLILFNPIYGFLYTLVIIITYYIIIFLRSTTSKASQVYLFGTSLSSARFFLFYVLYIILATIQGGSFRLNNYTLHFSEFWKFSSSALFSLIEIMSIACVILCIPILDIYFFLFRGKNSIFRIITIFREMKLYELGIFILSIGLVSSFILAFVHFVSKYPNLKWILYIIGGILCLSIMGAFWYNLIVDYLRFRKLKHSIVNNRENISRSFETLKTEFFRNKYIEHLQNSNITVTGTWPENFSLIGNEKSKILLSQLDEKWLGL